MKKNERFVITSNRELGSGGRTVRSCFSRETGRALLPRQDAF